MYIQMYNFILNTKHLKQLTGSPVTYAKDLIAFQRTTLKRGHGQPRQNAHEALTSGQWRHM